MRDRGKRVRQLQNSSSGRQLKASGAKVAFGPVDFPLLRKLGLSFDIHSQV